MEPISDFPWSITVDFLSSSIQNVHFALRKNAGINFFKQVDRMVDAFAEVSVPFLLMFSRRRTLEKL